MATGGQTKRRTNQPPWAKGKTDSVPFKVAIVSWIDLLGYGGMIANAEFNPADRRSRVPISRLRAFHRIVAEHSARTFRTLVLNDGAAAYRDLSMRGPDVTCDFLTRSFAMFTAINALEKANGFPGARMVMAVGFRSKGSRRAIDYTSGHLNSILSRLENGLISAEQAVKEAGSIQRYFDVLPQLQANFAFTKAYLADSSGSKAGLGGPRFFVDDAVFEGEVPTWLLSEDPISWEHAKLKLKANFIPISAVDIETARIANWCGLRDGLKVAEAIAPDTPILEAMRNNHR